jgi:hypothetical protein
MERDGVAVPQVLTEQPVLPIGLVMYLEAFYELDSERSHSMGALARIPWSKIISYGKHYGYDTEELLFFIRKMDDAHLEQLASSRTGGNDGGSTSTRTVVQRPPRPD